jgi:hypothetical protein
MEVFGGSILAAGKAVNHGGEDGEDGEDGEEGMMDDSVFAVLSVRSPPLAWSPRSRVN